MNRRHTIFTLIILVGITAGYFTARALLNREQKEKLNLYGTGYSREDVVRIDFAAKKASQSVVFKGGRYWIRSKQTGAYTLPARRKQMHTFFGGLEAADLIRKIDRKDMDLSEWGLGAEASRLVLTYGDGSSQEIFIGADNPVGRGVFIRIGSNDAAIYMVSNKLDIATEAILFQLIEDRILLAEPPDVTGFVIEGKKTEKWNKHRTVCTRLEDGRWQVTFPFTREADGKAVETYLEMLNTLRFETIDPSVQSRIDSEKPLCVFRAELDEDEQEVLELYSGGTDIIGRNLYRLANQRTGLSGYVLPSVFNAVNRSAVSFIWRRLFRGDPRNIAQISTKKGAHTVTFINKETGQWIVSEYFDAPADPRIMIVVLDAVMNFRVSRYISDKVEDLERTGLKLPSAILTINEKEDEGARSYCYYFGRQVEGTDEIYFKEIGSNEIYTVKYDFLEMLSRPARAYAMRKVNNIDKNLIEWVKIIRRDRKYTFRFSEIEGWYLRNPLLTRHINSALFNKLLALLDEMEFESIPLPETVPPDVFDDTHTEMTIEVKTRASEKPDISKSLWPENEKQITIIISSRKDSSGNIYAKRKFTNMTFTLKPETAAFFRQEFIDLSVCTEDISTALYLKLDYAEGTDVIIEKKGDSWRVKEPAGSSVDEKAVISYITFLNGLKAHRVFAYKTDEQQRKKLGFDTPLLSVTLSKGMDTEYGFSCAEHPRDPAGGLVKRLKEIYILEVSAADKTRIYVEPEYFMLEEKK